MNRLLFELSFGRKQFKYHSSIPHRKSTAKLKYLLSIVFQNYFHYSRFISRFSQSDLINNPRYSVFFGTLFNYMYSFSFQGKPIFYFSNKFLFPIICGKDYLWVQMFLDFFNNFKESWDKIFIANHEIFRIGTNFHDNKNFFEVIANFDEAIGIFVNENFLLDLKYRFYCKKNFPYAEAKFSNLRFGSLKARLRKEKLSFRIFFSSTIKNLNLKKRQPGPNLFGEILYKILNNQMGLSILVGYLNSLENLLISIQKLTNKSLENLMLGKISLISVFQKSKIGGKNPLIKIFEKNLKNYLLIKS